MLKCEICGAEGVVIRLLSRSYGQGPDLLAIPVISCPQCGEIYSTAEMLHRTHVLRVIASDKKILAFTDIQHDIVEEKVGMIRRVACSPEEYLYRLTDIVLNIKT